MTKTVVDIVGKKFGKLTVIKFSHMNYSSFWLCQCECGKYVIRNRNALVGETRQIKSCSRKCSLSRIEDSSVNRLLIQYMSRSRKKGLVFSLSCDRFEYLVHQPCFYCGKSPEKIGGIDRFDNAVGYTSENSIPCCKRCNKAKSNMHIDEFMSMVVDIYNNFIVGKVVELAKIKEGNL